MVGKQPLQTHRNRWEIKADSFRSQEPKEAIKNHPDLVGAYAIMRAAEVVAKENFRSRADQERFMALAKETLARQMAERHAVPEVRIREPKVAAELSAAQGKEIHIQR